MTMLKPATNKMAYAKVGVYGNAGSGKTYTSALIAIGLSKMTGNKPVAFFDTEPAAFFVKPLFDAAGIELFVFDESRALKDAMKFIDEAEAVCSVIIMDSITHIWRDIQESYLNKMNDGLRKARKNPINRLEFHHWRPIKNEWNKLTDRFLSSKVHFIICGRAGSIYEYQDKDDGSGKKELITTGTKMATEKEMGYEPSLLIEMYIDHDNGRNINAALVQKDRGVGADNINGQTFVNPKFEDFMPHFSKLNLGGEHFNSMSSRDSQELFTEEGRDGHSHEKIQRAIWCEEIEELLKKYYPSASNEHKAARQALLENTFKTRSWTKVTEMKSEMLKAAYEAMRLLLGSRAVQETGSEGMQAAPTISLEGTVESPLTDAKKILHG
jgi:AAA domain